MSDNIKVVVKVRPLISREIEEKQSYQWRVKNNTLYQVDTGKDYGTSFTFDQVYDEQTKTSHVYNDIAKPIVEAATAGFNGTIFAYGQTSSGKTYTMTGTETSPGIIPLAVYNLFEIIKSIPNRDFLVRVSYIEIYNETLKDLLNVDKKNIKVHDTLEGVKVDVTEQVSTSPEEVLKYLKEGEANRQTGATNMNEESSRSHSIFQIIIESREHIEGEEEVGCVNVSKLNLVDLAGSERAGQTGATGIRFKEGTHINKSLSTLALVIKQLSEDPNKHANYRDSKLTRILQNSLGGNAKTSIICAITPAAIDETISTLQFANRAKAIKNKPEVNAVATDATMIQSLTKQLSRLQSQLESKKNLEVMLESKKNVEQDNQNLQKQIANLQRLILNGFGHRSSMDMMGGRRKNNQLRRVTISTLHPVNEEPVCNIPKFCTPSLKYNPMSMPGAMDFVPIQNPTKLSSVPEETRLVTPPPREKKVNFDDIIELDSDDDDAVDVQPCSPYHKCYDKTKTPPCILRKIIIAEKDLKDIVELTEREKIYTPSVIELIEKLEQNTTVIAKLEDEITALNKHSKEKDLEIDHLRVKISKSEEELKRLETVKCDIESLNKDYITKLTDWEVTYETLKQKTKRREEELLSLLDEQKKCIRTEESGKLSRTAEKELSQFMDMSKDISLVNSDNECSIVNTNDEEPSSQIQDIVAGIQTQLSIKTQSVVELEVNLHAQKQKVESLEFSCNELRGMLDSFKEKLFSMENENSYLKSTVDTLNSTIESQKESLNIANNDIDSYNSLIQELQIKLSKKEGIEVISINESVLEKMIANEEKIIANNENIKNIIQSFKIALDSRNKEIISLKSTLSSNSESNTSNSIVQIDAKNKEINSFMQETQDLKKQINENVLIIENLRSENDNLLKIEHKLNEEISKVKEENNKLEKSNERNLLQLESLNKITSLEGELNLKDDLILSLQKDEKHKQDNLSEAKNALIKLQNISTKLTGNIQEIPEIIDNFVVIFKTLNENLNILDSIVTELVAQREIETIDRDNLRTKISDLHENHTKELTLLQSEILSLSSKATELEYLHQKIQLTTNELEKARVELTTRNDEFLNLECKIDILNKDNEDLRNSITLKDNLITSLKESEQKYVDTQKEIENVIYTLQEKQNDYDKVILEKDSKIVDLEYNMEESKKSLDEKSSEIKEYVKKLNDNIEGSTKALLEMNTVQSENNSLNKDLQRATTLLETLQEEVKIKTTIVENMESKLKDWKNQYLNLNSSINQRIQDLEMENKELKLKCSEISSRRYNYDICKDLITQKNDVNKSILNLMEKIECCSPPSLLTICCNKIIEHMEPKEKTLSSTSTTSISSIETFNKETRSNDCQCSKLLSDLAAAREENLKLVALINEVETINQDLVNEQKEIREEIKLLIEPAFELQKKVINHRTNLSTLTATTYAENKSLKSQVKVLQHHHSRFHVLCQRDIPAVKKQLCELMSILKRDSSFIDNHSASFKRYSLPDMLDNNSLLSNFKSDDLTLDGDLLMLDTNVTLATSADNTLMGHDQTCLDLTQTFTNEAACQTNDMTQLIDFNTLQTKFDIISSDNEKLSENLKVLKNENEKLCEQLDLCAIIKVNMVDSETSPLKSMSIINEECPICERYKAEKIENLTKHDKLKDEIKLLLQDLSHVKNEKEIIEAKYKNLTLEIPSTEALVRKYSNLEKEYGIKTNEIAKLTQTLSNKNLELKQLQEENDNLSTQIMENISEADDLNKELDTMKNRNAELNDKCSELQRLMEENNKLNITSCPQCAEKENIIESLSVTSVSQPHSKLNRSLSESDTSSRYNKICTLQNELHASKEDCKELTEDVTTIKNHLDRNNLSMEQNMDLDYSMGDPSIFSSSKDFETVDQSHKSNMFNIPEESESDIYTHDKNDCLNYYLEIAGDKKENYSSDIKIVEIMKMLYNHIVTKHNNNVENLVNKLKSYENSRKELEIHVNSLESGYSELNKDNEIKNSKLKAITDTILLLKNNINVLKENIPNFTQTDRDNKAVTLFKENVLKLLDNEFSLNSIDTFESIINSVITKNDNDLSEAMNRYLKLEEHAISVTSELNKVNDSLLQMKSQLTDKENEYNLLKAQNERIHEISSAVTLDIVKKEKELNEVILNGWKNLVENNIVYDNDLNLTSSLNVDNIFDHLIKQYKKQSDLTKASADGELKKLNSNLESKEKELEIIIVQNNKLQEINKNVTLDLIERDNALLTQKSLYDNLNEVYKCKVEENIANLSLIDKLTEEINILKENILSQQAAIENLNSEIKSQMHNNLTVNENKILELTNTITALQKEVNDLKTVNQIIIKEKENSALELEKSNETIKTNKIELERMTSDVLILRESVKENMSVVETLKLEAKSLLQQNLQLKDQIEEKSKQCARLEMNIKTHEKTAQIQSKMIIRLQKQKEDDDKALNEKDKLLSDLAQKHTALQQSCDNLQSDIKATKNEYDTMKNMKESLQVRIMELEAEIESFARHTPVEAPRRRRQSVYNSKRTIFESKECFEDHTKADAVFGSHAKPDDLFMDVDDDSSNRSTPLRLSKGRDSLLSRHDQSSAEESSASATRQRRQSSHDLRRSVTPHPHDTSKSNEAKDLKSADTSEVSELNQVREQLASCQQELEELKERYKELDEECETCAEYLRNRESQCARLKKEKATLENIVTDLREKLQSVNPNQTLQDAKRKFVHAEVNTDEDWANLHSVVVDRMSYDAEVEKNKRLTKTIEELRFKKQELKTTLTKMQKFIEKNVSKDNSRELEATKQELHECKQVLEELRVRCKELDEECETCGVYLKEKDDVIRKLKETITILEAKLQEYEEDHSAMLQSNRKKRQSLHDQNRGSSSIDVNDATTETTDDFLNSQVERDVSTRQADESRTQEIRRLKMMVDKLSWQKTSLERQLGSLTAAAAPPAMYIATGSAIVQNQQLTDVMKENQKLKKINAKLVTICKKRGKESNRENEDPTEKAG
ncbi:LOW QUALITY PROTEIN: uncharacterized protein ACR2FA_007831 [Aphomia sociella]